jgi:hypothetical protein
MLPWKSWTMWMQIGTVSGAYRATVPSDTGFGYPFITFVNMSYILSQIRQVSHVVCNAAQAVYTVGL